MIETLSMSFSSSFSLKFSRLILNISLEKYDEFNNLLNPRLINPQQNIKIFFKGFNSSGENISKQLHKNDINVKRHK